MFEQEQNCQASFTKVFYGEEDDVVDTLLALLRREGWEDLKLHYETGSMTAEKTVLRTRTTNGSKEELPLTFALNASWFEADSQVEMVVEVVETDFEWTGDECASEVDSILLALQNRFGAEDPTGEYDTEGDEN